MIVSSVAGPVMAAPSSTRHGAASDSESLTIAQSLDGEDSLSPRTRRGDVQNWLSQYTDLIEAFHPAKALSFGQRLGKLISTTKAFGTWAHAPMMVVDNVLDAGFSESLEDVLKFHDLKSSVPELATKYRDLLKAIDHFDDLGPAGKTS